ncbi:MAG: hypothetical protein CVV12_05080 [Gammaproteobacteria bacterium HGW-Gammaproteobacteria-2]|jgi:hypothetical protein|nr:MAG: hypothetical protein CVV12_05080 [Gammaproteobacteria bacterium HGW-Gammaproteobacteria-2]
MSAEYIADLCRRHLEDQLTKSGSILYSAAATLKPGRIYLLGLNPGGDEGLPLESAIDELPGKTSNAYIDEAWEQRGCSYKEGQAPLQDRVRWLVEVSPLAGKLEETCASNLIFRQTHDAGGLEFQKEGDRYWPIHEKILEIVNPSVIICFGNSARSPYAFLRDKLQAAERESVPAGHGNWRLRSAEVRLSNGKRSCLLGIPHMSRYKPNGKKVVCEWITRNCAAHI